MAKRRIAFCLWSAHFVFFGSSNTRTSFWPPELLAVMQRAAPPCTLPAPQGVTYSMVHHMRGRPLGRLRTWLSLRAFMDQQRQRQQIAALHGNAGVGSRTDRKQDHMPASLLEDSLPMGPGHVHLVWCSTEKV